MRRTAPLAFALVLLDPRTLVADRAQDVARAKQAARENALLPAHDGFHQQATREADAFLEPLLQECALQDCLGAGLSNSYVVRVQADGSLGEVFVEPANRFGACLEAGLKARARLRTPPPSDGYWISWSVSGIMRLPAGCREELTPPAWHTLNWWLFLGGEVFPSAASRIRTVLLAVSLIPFLLALTGWKLLRPDDHGRQLLLSLAIAAALLLLAAAAAYGIGRLADEGRYDNRENVLMTLLFAFPFLASLPFAVRGLRSPQVQRGSRGVRPTAVRVKSGPRAAGPARRAAGLLLLFAAMLPATAMTWFAAHENANRLCRTCVEPYKLQWALGRLLEASGLTLPTGRQND